MSDTLTAADLDRWTWFYSDGSGPGSYTVLPLRDGLAAGLTPVPKDDDA